MKKLFVIILILAFSICLLLTACSNQALNNSSISSNKESSLASSKFNSSFNEQASSDKNDSQEATRVEKILKDIGFGEKVSLLSDTSYRSRKEEHKQLFAVGLEGIPELMKKIYDSKSYDSYDSFLLHGIYSLLRMDNFNLLALKYPISLTEEEAFQAFLSDSRKDIPDIIASNMSNQEKVSELRKYGVLCIPYLTKDMINSSNEYQQLFVSIGLHMEVDEWMEHVIAAEDDNWYKSKEFLKGSDSFNYKRWLKDNEKDLTALNEYINSFVS